MYALHCAKILNELSTEIVLLMNYYYSTIFSKLLDEESPCSGVKTIVTVISLSSIIINFHKLTNVIVVLVQS